MGFAFHGKAWKRSVGGIIKFPLSIPPPSSVKIYPLSHTSSINFLSWDTLITAPLNPASILRITGPDKGEKFLVGSSKISTFAPLMAIFDSKSFALDSLSAFFASCGLQKTLFKPHLPYIVQPLQYHRSIIFRSTIAIFNLF